MSHLCGELSVQGAPVQVCVDFSPFFLETVLFPVERTVHMQ